MKIKNIILGGLAAVSLASCADMDYHEYKVDDKDYIANKFSNVYGFMTTIYQNLDYDLGTHYSGAMLASATDEAVYSHQGNQIESFYNGAWGPSNANSATWSNAWKGISYCNLFLDEFNNLKFEDYQLDLNYKAEMEKYNNFQWEARWARALFYFQLVRYYGGVPLKTENLDAETANNLPRVPADTIFKFIDDECVAIKDTIIKDYTKAFSELGLIESGRANNLEVLALRARAALYHASPLFTQGKKDEEKKELWLKAAQANWDVINACRQRSMSLCTDYAAMFNATSWSNAAALKEVIFGVRIAKNNNIEKWNFPIGMENAGGGNCPTQNLVDAYECTDGLSITESPLYDPQNPYANRDPRLAMTIAVNGETYPDALGAPLQTYYGGSNGLPTTYGTPTGYYLKKYMNRDAVIGASNATTNYHIFIQSRLAEFYLNYAEAVLNYMGSGYEKPAGYSMSAADAINTVRGRNGVKMPDIPTGLDFEAFKQKYENERFVELAFEGHRFFDVRRWMEGPKYFVNIKTMKITKNSDDTFTYAVETNPSSITKRQWDDKYYFAPIPQSEIMKSGALEQNPGW